MEKLPSLGTRIFDIIVPTARIYTPLLQANASAIRATERQEYTYGSHPRQKLDLFTAHTRPENAQQQNPVLIFLYGGGFVNGAKRSPIIAGDLLYSNVGHFYASHGFETIVPDYRLAGSGAYGGHDATYPQGSEDVAGVIKWVRDNLCKEQKRSLFLVGASAGGTHLATMMFHPSFEQLRTTLLSSSTTLSLRGVIYMGAVFSLNPELMAEAGSTAGVSAYYGDDEEEWEGKSPVVLLQHHTSSSTALPPTLICTAEFDPTMITKAKDAFLNSWRASGREELTALTVQGHNHVSSNMALGTGRAEEERWSEDVLKWMKSKL